ncbi:hypothetical protein IHE45_02G079400 [Dioscorea alata]|uniref:Uncharacterized protein n=1 Tax=Dioscorea alata TaxID=55571 RepID=A0ACB7WRY8_DIOAL|nr:hypothetical protein IHE45_02G079400 [Dioscorea alata]
MKSTTPVGVGLGDKDEMEEAHPGHSSTANAPNEVAEKRGPRAKCKRQKPMADAVSALTIIAQSSQKLTNVLKKQASQSHINVQVILEKVRELGLADNDVMALIQIFVHDEKEARFFFEINDKAFLHAWVNHKLNK